MTTTQMNINSAAFRLDQRRPQPVCERCGAPGVYRKIINVGKLYANVTVCEQHKEGAK